MIQRRVVDIYRQELERAKMPGYVSRYDEEFDTPDSGEEYGAEMTPPRSLRTDRPHAPPETDDRRARPKETRPTPATSKRPEDTFGNGIL
jgi:hypothetical protein